MNFFIEVSYLHVLDLMTIEVSSTISSNDSLAIIDPDLPMPVCDIVQSFVKHAAEDIIFGEYEESSVKCLVSISEYLTSIELLFF